MCKAYDLSLRRTVALKFLSRAGRTGPVERDPVLHEARAACALDHENIATVHAVSHSDDGHLFIVMAYYEGGSLASRLQAGPLRQSEAIEIIRQIANGLAHAHAHGIVHADIKPSNVMFSREGTAKIVDFGLARFVSADATTESLGVAGTLPYMSPEQLSGQVVDARTDLWSLGVLMYQLLTHRLPFQRETAVAMFTAILNSAPAEMTGVPLRLQRITYRALSKDVAYRYQTAAELIHDLDTVTVSGDEGHAAALDEHEFQRCLRFASALSTAPSAGLKRRRWRLAMLAVAVVVLGLISYSPVWLGLLRNVTPNRMAAPSAPVAHKSYLQGMEYLDRYDKPGNLNAAIKFFESTTKVDPKFALAYVGLAEAYWDKYRLDENPKWIELSSAACNQAAALDDRLPSLYIMLARIHDGTGQYDLALQEVQRALALDALNPDALLALAGVYAHVGRIAEAEETYRRVTALRPNGWRGHYRFGDFFYAQGRFQDAAAEFQRVIQLAPDHAEAHASLALMWMSLGKLAEAEQEYRKSIALVPGYAAYTNLGQLYLSQKRYAEAVAMTEKGLALNDNDYRVWYDLAITYEWLGKDRKAHDGFRRAQGLLEKIEHVQERDPTVHADLGVVYAQQSSRSQAVAQLKIALALAPKSAEIHGKAGEAYERLGERGNAIEYLQSALRLGWTFTDLETSPALRGLLSDPRARKALQQVQPPGQK